jgi:hypothetical protein
MEHLEEIATPHTEMSKDTRGDTLGESFVQIITSTEFEKLFFFFRRE